MAKNYEVELHYVFVVAVEGAENEEEATEFAEEEASMSMAQALIESRARVVGGKDWESTVRHAHAVNRPD